MKKILVITLIVTALMVMSKVTRCQNSHKVLVITGKHPYNEIAFNEMLQSFKGLDCTVKQMGDNPGTLFEKNQEFDYDAIVMYNFNQTLLQQHKEVFMKKLQSGVGLTVIHHALAGFPDWKEYENIIGATYVLEEQKRKGKPIPRPTWKHGVDMEIRVEDPLHPITKGIGDFRIHDETYKGWIYHDGNHLLLSTNNELSNSQIAWTRENSNNRVFCIQLGHDEHAFNNENFCKLIQQGILWTINNGK